MKEVIFMFAKLNSLGLLGIDAYPVSVEVDFHRGMPSFEIVGLPDATIRESRDRVKAAMGNCGLDLPAGRIVVNLAPADVRKIGTLYDLPILVGLLCATGQLAPLPPDCALLGELSLSGEVRPQCGVLSMVLEARKQGFRRVFLPALNASEGAIAENMEIYPVSAVGDLIAHFSGSALISAARRPEEEPAAISGDDFADVRGQDLARRAAEIAAAGGHNLLMIGAPGSGKSMIAKRIPSILPPMTFSESIETTRVYSAAGMLTPGASLIRQRPFRAPHHTVSPAGLAGGGTIPRPGEISLAHQGVLFLDELPEFSRAAMEVLRQPLENNEVIISRASARLRFPSDVMLVAAMNPCPCGYFGHPSRPCICTPARAAAYAGKVSGPLIDRLDLYVEVLPVLFNQLSSTEKAECSADIRKRVLRARKRQWDRQTQAGATCNARLSPAMLNSVCAMTSPARAILKRAFDTMGLSARAYDRVLKVAKTIADLDGSDEIDRQHIAEAVQYRSLDRKYWNRA